jgi:hypothetical protein
MAININPGKPLRQIATFNSSGNWTASAATNLAFVSIHGASGGGAAGTGYFNDFGVNRTGGSGGTGVISSAWVQVTPSAAHVITIGAGGAGGAGSPGPSGTGGSTGGTTTFDGALSAIGAGGGLVGSGNTPGGAGSAGTSSGQTAYSTVSPSNSALKRTGTIANQTSGGFGGGAGSGAGPNGPSGAGSAGSSGQIHIYV